MARIVSLTHYSTSLDGQRIYHTIYPALNIELQFLSQIHRYIHVVTIRLLQRCMKNNTYYE